MHKNTPVPVKKLKAQLFLIKERPRSQQKPGEWGPPSQPGARNGAAAPAAQAPESHTRARRHMRVRSPCAPPSTRTAPAVPRSAGDAFARHLRPAPREVGHTARALNPRNETAGTGRAQAKRAKGPRARPAGRAAGRQPRKHGKPQHGTGRSHHSGLVAHERQPPCWCTAQRGHPRRQAHTNTQLATLSSVEYVRVR